MANNGSDLNQRFFKNLLIYPKMQLKYMFLNLAICLILIISYSIVFYTFIKENYFAFIDLGFLDDAVKNQMYLELNKVTLILFGCSLLFLFIVIYVSISFTHRVAGPIYKLTKVLKEMREAQNIKKINFRKNDEFKELSEELNLFIDHLNKEQAQFNSSENNYVKKVP